MSGSFRLLSSGCWRPYGAGSYLLPRWICEHGCSVTPSRVERWPLGLPPPLWVNAVISQFLLGYGHVLLLLPALIFLAAAGLPGAQTAQEEARNSTLWRLAIYVWMAVLPLLLVLVQSALGSK